MAWRSRLPKNRRPEAWPGRPPSGPSPPLPGCRSTNRQADPEVWFRIIHLAQDCHKGAPVAAYHEQMVEIALGPKGAFGNGKISSLRRRAPPAQVVNAVPPGRGNSKPPEPRTPRVVELLRKAIEWQVLLESGKIVNQADIARQEGITRARVTEVMGILRFAPEIRDKILSTPNAVRRPPVTERVLRPIATIADDHDQILEFHKLLG